MKHQMIISSRMLMIGICFVFILSGCISVKNSPASRFYLLGSAHEDPVSRVKGYALNKPEPGFSRASKKIKSASDLFIGVGPVKIPEYQDRPQIVTRDKKMTLKFAQFDRWGEPLDLGLERLIGGNLTEMLPGAEFTLHPWNLSIPVKYQVVVEIVQLDSQLDKDLFLIAQWLIIDLRNTQALVIRRSEFRQPIKPQDYPGLVKALTTACFSLSNEIAEALAMLENHPENKDESLAP